MRPTPSSRRGKHDRQAGVGRGVVLGQSGDLRQHLRTGQIGVVQKNRNVDLLIAVFHQPIGHHSPQSRHRLGRLGIQAQLQGHQPQQFRRFDRQQVDLGRRVARVTELFGEDLQEKRLAAAVRPQQQSDAAMLLDQEMQPGQRLVVGWALIEKMRV